MNKRPTTVAPPSSPCRSLRVVASGICSSLGYTAQATSCALRAGMDHFQESYFMAPNGQALLVARLPDTTHGGAQRLGLWMNYALADCMAHAPDDVGAIENIPICFLTSEPSRPHSELEDYAASVRALHQLLKIDIHTQSLAYAGGRAGVGTMLLKVKETLQNSKPATPYMLLMGVDSLLNAANINQLVAEERLLYPGSPAGLIPGEAAAALLLEWAPASRSGLHISGMGFDRAQGRPDGSVPSRARALSRAMRQAMQQAGITTHDLSFRLSDQNGEAFFAKEAANAITRVTEAGGPTLSTLTTADGTGEIGSATGPLMLAWLHHTMARADGPGSYGLIHLANDMGERCALTVRWQP